MATPLVFATCREYPQLDEDSRLVLAHLPAETQIAIWNDPTADWSRYGMIIIRSIWDYHRHASAFSAWLDEREAEGARLCNPAPMLRWNMNKTYLRDLERQGVPVVPTVWLGRGEVSDLRAIVKQRGWQDVVIKPTISASGENTWRLREHDITAFQPRLERLLTTYDLMVQPFIPEIIDEGEWSFVFFNGQYSHAVRKQPAPGEFRSQSEQGGSVIFDKPTAGMVQQAQNIVRQFNKPHTYARVDVVNRGGQLLLMELELIEPELYLRADEEAPARFAQAIMQYR